MAELGIDTSSYPKPVQPPSALDQLGKYQQIESNKLSIDKQKLDLVNQRFGELSKSFTSLINDPDLTDDKFRKTVTDQVKLGYIPAEMAASIFSIAPTNNPTDLKAWLAQQRQHAQTVVEGINYYAGQNTSKNDQANEYQGVTASPERGGGFRPATKLPVQLPPTTSVPNNQSTLPNGQPNPNYMQPGYLGPSGPSGVQPANQQPAPLPVARPPIAPVNQPAASSGLPVSGPTGPTVDRGTEFNNRFSASFPNSIPSGPPPLFEGGKSAYEKGQIEAAGLMQTNKPAIQALNIMQTNFPNGKGLATGPGTKQFNELVAAAKAWGITDTKAENDPTVLRQELEKKLAQFVSTSPIAGRSDAAQVLAETASPNPKIQILPALINLTRDAIALNRVSAAKNLAFQGRTDFQNYGQHIANFPQSVDERAFTLDLMPEEERVKLVNKMTNQYKNGDARQKREADKFLNSYKIAKKLEFY